MIRNVKQIGVVYRHPRQWGWRFFDLSYRGRCERSYRKWEYVQITDSCLLFGMFVSGERDTIAALGGW